MGFVSNINIIANKLTEVDSDGNPILDLSNLNSALTYSIEAKNSATIAKDSADIVIPLADTVVAEANNVSNLVSTLQTLSIGSVITGTPTQPTTVTYDSASNTFSFSIPQGIKGDRGEAFRIDAYGTDITLYDNMLVGFSFLDIIESKVYFKLSSTTGDWSTGILFGKGDTGDTGATGNGIVSIIFTSTTDASGQPSKSGAVDTYTITMSDSTTSSISVYNGIDGLPNYTIQTSDYTAVNMDFVYCDTSVLMAQVDTVAIVNVLVSTTYTVTIDGVGYTYTSTTTDTVTGIVNGLVTAINAGVGVPVTASNITDTLVLTANVAGTAFTTTVDTNMSVITTTQNKVGSFTVTLPALPSANDKVAIMDIATSFSTNPLSIARNGNTIMGLAEDMLVDTDNISFELIYVNNDWRIK